MIERKKRARDDAEESEEPEPVRQVKRKKIADVTTKDGAGSKKDTTVATVVSTVAPRDNAAIVKENAVVGEKGAQDGNDNSEAQEPPRRKVRYIRKKRASDAPAAPDVPSAPAAPVVIASPIAPAAPASPTKGDNDSVYVDV